MAKKRVCPSTRKPCPGHICGGVVEKGTARGTQFLTENRLAKWKAMSHFVNMEELLPFGAYPSGAYMGNPG